MKFITLFTLSIFFVPAIATAQSIQTLLPNIVIVINQSFLPFLFSIAFVLFVYNAFRYFILNGENEKGRENAKNLAIYSVTAFVFLIIFWGIVNLLSTSSGLEGKNKPCPDYLERKGGC